MGTIIDIILLKSGIKTNAINVTVQEEKKEMKKGVINTCSENAEKKGEAARIDKVNKCSSQNVINMKWLCELFNMREDCLCLTIGRMLLLFLWRGSKNYRKRIRFLLWQN